MKTVQGEEMLTQSHCKKIKTSDGVALSTIDFIPEILDPSKPVLVFVAGWISRIEGWAEVLKVLTTQYRTLYIETREKISAQLPTDQKLDFSIARMSQDIAEALDQLLPQNQPFCFAGSSLGATVTLDYLSKSKRQPMSSFLISPVSEFHIPTWALALIRVLPASFYPPVKALAKWYLKNFRLDAKKEPEQVAKYEGTLDAAEPKRLKANVLAVKDYKVWDKLSKIPSPVYIIGAHSDKLHGVEDLKKVVSLLPKGRLELMASNKETHSEKAGLFVAQQIASNKFS